MGLEPTNERVAVRDVRPQVDAGRFPAKGVAGQPIEVEADVYADGHDLLAAVVTWRRSGRRQWEEEPLEPGPNDRWTGSFVPDEPGRYEFRVVGWVDHVATWRRDVATKAAADTLEPVDLAVGAALLRDLAEEAHDEQDRDRLQQAADDLEGDDRAAAVALAADDELAQLAQRVDPRRHATRSDRLLRVRVDRPRAQYSSWYELFPRSAADEPGRHGTLRDVIDRLPYVASMHFDVLYLPPIHPIGSSHRKGPDNVPTAGPKDVGSPWAIGSQDGGHTAIHPELGTFEDFDALVAACEEQGLELALDIAFQCSPDHPWVAEHPQWFRQRPDGSIQYAENPPKKYQDIYPFDFETEDAEGLWQALRGVFEFWIERGVRIFRVDNPHTKSFPFWEWCIDALTADHPDVIFLAEAFTRPKVMYELAKRGFTQSYTYFAWRNVKWEIEQYYTELFTTDVADFFRSNAWPNTPDILTDFLHDAGRPAFTMRLVLAATLSANYGIYGPPFELMENQQRPGAEEYARNEKYQLRDWDLDRPDSLRELIARVNGIRRDHPALQQDRRFTFHHVDNEQLVAFSKTSADGQDVVLVVVNLDPHHTHAATTWLDMAALGLDHDAMFEVHDLLGGGRYQWQGPSNYVELDPHVSPAHVFAVRPPAAAPDAPTPSHDERTG